MKKTISFLFAVLLTKLMLGQVCDGQQVFLSEDGECDNHPWVKVFEDNFESTTLDLSKWTLPYQGVTRDYDFINSKQWLANTGNTPSISFENNIQIEGGILKLIARNETVVGSYITDWSANPPTSASSTFNFTSAEIGSKYQFGYGQFEIRCKIPKGKGFWPAFWMYGENSAHVNNEIDVFEFWDDNTNDHNMTVHYNGQMCLSDYNGPDYSQAFHTFTVIWDNYQIAWYVDGDLKRRSTKFYSVGGGELGCSSISAFQPYIMDKVYPKDPMAIIAGLAIQNGADEPNSNTTFPSALEIDYIRYYQRRECVDVVNISNNTQLNLSNEIYNVITGTSIKLGGSVSLHNGKQLDVLAKEEIELSPGFSAELGSDFVARIDPTMCYGNVNGLNQSSLENPPIITENDSHLRRTIDRNEENTDLEIRMYPNPTVGILNIEFERNYLEQYVLYLTDSQGKVIYSIKPIQDKIIKIDLTGFSKGIYALTVLNPITQEAIVRKIIHK